MVDTRSQPAGNVTGVSGVGPELSAKLVELIREIVPSAHRAAVLANAPGPYSKPFLEQIQLAGEATGTAIAQIMIHSAEELDAAFSAMQK